MIKYKNRIKSILDYVTDICYFQRRSKHSAYLSSLQDKSHIKHILSSVIDKTFDYSIFVVYTEQNKRNLP